MLFPPTASGNICGDCAQSNVSQRKTFSSGNWLEPSASCRAASFILSLLHLHRCPRPSAYCLANWGFNEAAETISVVVSNFQVWLLDEDLSQSLQGDDLTSHSTEWAAWNQVYIQALPPMHRKLCSLSSILDCDADYHNAKISRECYTFLTTSHKVCL